MKHRQVDIVRMIAIIVVSLFVIATGAYFSLGAFSQGDIAGGSLGAVIAIIILVFAAIVFSRGNRALREGFPIQDERSIRIKEKASSTAFYVSLYLLLAVGFLSDGIIQFRDVSQATGITVGGMGLLFALFWAMYSRMEI